MQRTSPAYFDLLPVMRYTCRSRRYGDAAEVGLAARHSGLINTESRRARAGAWICDRAEAGTGVAACRASAAGLAVSRAAPAGEPRTALGGLEGNGNGARGEILSLDGERARATRDRSR